MTYDPARDVLPAVVLRLDPAAQFYTWFAGVTTVGVIVLMVTTSAALGLILARNHPGLRHP